MPLLPHVLSRVLPTVCVSSFPAAAGSSTLASRRRACLEAAHAPIKGSNACCRCGVAVAGRRPGEVGDSPRCGAAHAEVCRHGRILCGRCRHDCYGGGDDKNCRRGAEEPEADEVLWSAAAAAAAAACAASGEGGVHGEGRGSPPLAARSSVCRGVRRHACTTARCPRPRARPLSFADGREVLRSNLARPVPAAAPAQMPIRPFGRSRSSPPTDNLDPWCGPVT